MSQHNTFVAAYAQRHLAETDLKKMQAAGFDFNKLRIVTHHPERLGKLQPITPVLTSFGELDAAYFSCIPEQDIVDFEAGLGTGRLFIVAHGSPDEIEQAKRIADSTHQPSWDGLADAAIYYGCAD